MEYEDGCAGHCGVRLSRRADGVRRCRNDDRDDRRARLSLGEPFVSEDSVSRSLVLVLLAGPYMVANDAMRANREKRIGAVGLGGIFALCGVWLFATGVLILGAVSEFSVLSATASTGFVILGRSRSPRGLASASPRTGSANCADPRIHACTVRPVADSPSNELFSGACDASSLAGARPQCYGMDPRVCAVRFAPAPPLG